MPSRPVINVDDHRVGQPDRRVSHDNLVVNVLLHAMEAVRSHNDLLVFSGDSIHKGHQITVHNPTVGSG